MTNELVTQETSLPEQRNFPVNLAAEVIARALSIESELQNVTDPKSDLMSDRQEWAETSISRETLIGAAKEAGISEEAMLRALKDIDTKVNVASGKILTRQRLGLPDDASQTQVADELAIKKGVQPLIDRLDEVVSLIVNEGKTFVALDGEGNLISRCANQASCPVNHAPYRSEKIPSRTKQPFWKRKREVVETTLTSPVLKEFYELIQSYGLGLDLYFNPQCRFVCIGISHVEGIHRRDLE